MLLPIRFTVINTLRTVSTELKFCTQNAYNSCVVGALSQTLLTELKSAPTLAEFEGPLRGGDGGEKGKNGKGGSERGRKILYTPLDAKF